MNTERGVMCFQGASPYLFPCPSVSSVAKPLFKMPSLPDIPAELGGHRFAEPALAREALTHSSAQRKDSDGNPFDSERLEFLGDAVLGLVLADTLHASRPVAREGELSGCRAALASRPALAKASRALGLPSLVDAGDEAASAARIREMDSVAENVFEATVGAVYRDAGLDAARAFVLRALGEALESVKPVDSPKNRLQELLQSRAKGGNAGALIEYRTVATEGPDHARRFTVEVWFDGAPRGRGEGVSVKVAGESAARAALAEFTE
jgi:ribonuclease-3